MRQLTGRDHAPSRENLPENAILVARSMGPAALLDYDRKRLRGLVLEEGGPHSHVAIVARALGIAAVGEIDNATGIADPGDAIIVDGSTGDVHIRPLPDMEAAYAERVRLRARRQQQYQALRDKPCVTKDGEEITLLHQCRPERRPAAYRRYRRRRHRPVPHRAAIHGGAEFPAHQRAVHALPRRARCRRRQAGDLPHARHRRRQGAALYAQRRGGESGARLARDPARPRPARLVAHAVARAAARRRQPRAQDHVSR